MKIVAEEHWVKKGPVKLYVYRKHDADKANKPVLFLVHGSTFSSRGTYDLMVNGKGDYSAMHHFASLGYDVWTMDHEGYGFSDRTDSASGIMVGVADLQAAMPLVLEKSGQKSVLLFGEVLRRDQSRRVRQRRAGQGRAIDDARPHPSR